MKVIWFFLKCRLFRSVIEIELRFLKRKLLNGELICGVMRRCWWLFIKCGIVVCGLLVWGLICLVGC